MGRRRGAMGRGDGEGATGRGKRGSGQMGGGKKGRGEGISQMDMKMSG